MDGQMFHTVFGERDTVLLHGMKIVLDSGTVYVEKQNLQEKDLEKVRKMMKV